MSNEELEFLKENVKGKTVQELSDMIYEEFGTRYTKNQLTVIKSKNGLKSGAIATSKPKYPEHIEYLKEIYKGRSLQEITDLMNKKFNVNYSKKAIQTMKWRYNLKSGYLRSFTNHPEYLEFLKENVKGTSRKDLTRMFNEKFGTDYPVEKVINWLRYYNLTNGIDAQYKKGNVPMIKKPIGSEYLKDGVVFIKVAEPDIWERKNRYIYKQAHGTLPDNYDVIHLNGDKTDFNIENLAAIERKDTLTMKNAHLFSNDAELTKIGILTAKITNKRSELIKGRKIC